MVLGLEWVPRWPLSLGELTQTLISAIQLRPVHLWVKELPTREMTLLLLVLVPVKKTKTKKEM